MINYKYILMIVWVCVINAPLVLGAETGDVVTVADLLAQSQAYTGKTVTIQGEAIGPVLREGRFVWVNLLDGNRALGAWMRSSMGNAVSHTGRYSRHGDDLKVTGVFNRACSLHGGDCDIHAVAVVRVHPGYRLKHPISKAKKHAVAFWLLAALFSIIGGVLKERS
ncbi:MAG: DNA-binding protein [Candidatus Omnitrophica bacterium]|nr:DNA-binding protein [Candidatus Omnitrophota bacterium]